MFVADCCLALRVACCVLLDVRWLRRVGCYVMCVAACCLLCVGLLLVGVRCVLPVVRRVRCVVCCVV